MRNRVSDYFCNILSWTENETIYHCIKNGLNVFVLLGYFVPPPFSRGTLMFCEMILFEIAVILVSYLVI